MHPSRVPADCTTAPLPMPALGAKNRAVFEDVAEIARMRGGNSTDMSVAAQHHMVQNVNCPKAHALDQVDRYCTDSGTPR